MVSQTLPTQTLSPPVSSLPTCGTLPLKNADSDDNVCGWLVNRTTFKICLVIHRDHSAFIGRHPSCGLVLSDDVISSRHCRFYTSSSGFVLCEDLSTNGTYWNGRLIGRGDSMALSHGDLIRIRCSHQFVYHDLSTPPSDHRDPEIETVEQTYQILPGTLGRGSFAKVKLAIHRKTKVQLAVKIMDRVRFSCPEKSGGTDIDAEASILRSINHANIVPVVDVIKTSKYMYIFMQVLLGGDLFDYIRNHGPLPEMEAKFAIYQTLLALQHLHNLNISHRDMKPENLLLKSVSKYPRLLLTDFGMARELEDGGVMTTMCGTFAYMAPEVFGVKHARGPGYDSTADIWSLGITLYVILSGSHPFTKNYSNEDEISMYRKVRTGNLEFRSQIWKSTSLQAKGLIHGLLQVDPGLRWTVKEALDSEWIQMDQSWLQQKYQGETLKHWIRCSRALSAVTRSVSSRTEGQRTARSENKRDLPSDPSDVDVKEKRSAKKQKKTQGTKSTNRAAVAPSVMAQVPQVSTILRSVESQSSGGEL